MLENIKEIIDEQTGEVIEVDSTGADIVACQYKYTLGLKPKEYEDVDPVPLAVPLDGEVPLTFREQLMRFGYSNPNPALYDDEDDGDEDDFEDVSPFYIDDEGLNAIDRQALREQAERDELSRLAELGRRAEADSQQPTTPPSNNELVPPGDEQ